MAAKHVLNHWFIDDYTPQTLFFMEKHCSTISFWLKNRTDKNGKSPITMVIAANGERAEFQTGKKIEAVNWDS